MEDEREDVREEEREDADDELEYRRFSPPLSEWKDSCRQASIASRLSPPLLLPPPPPPEAAEAAAAHGARVRCDADSGGGAMHVDGVMGVLAARPQPWGGSGKTRPAGPGVLSGGSGKTRAGELDIGTPPSPPLLVAVSLAASAAEELGPEAARVGTTDIGSAPPAASASPFAWRSARATAERAR
jgi:hypothetical protein